MSLTEWAPLRLLDADFLKQVRLCYVFGWYISLLSYLIHSFLIRCSRLIIHSIFSSTGSTGHEALMVTDEDEVFACGLNFEGCLGLITAGPHIEPALIPELCKKKVKGELASA